jgi:cytochrome P450
LPTVDRICTSECEVGDLHLTVGERLRLRLAGDADGSSGLPFGLGAHFCPGAAWVRAVSRAGVIALADRLRGYAVASVEYADISQQPAGPVALRMRASNSCPR